METFTVALFGHRKMEHLWQLDALLFPLLGRLIRQKDHVTFLIGRQGEFDEYAASLIKKAQRAWGRETCEIVLVLPYRVADLPYYEAYYDGIVIPDSVCGAHPKAAGMLKNRWMVDAADLVIGWVERKQGGAFSAMQYGKRKNKNCIDLPASGETNFFPALDKETNLW